MKKTQWIDALRNIQKKWVSFFSVCIIMGLGVGGFFVTRFVTNSLHDTAIRVYENVNFKNLEVVSVLGFQDKEISEIQSSSVVEDVEGVLVMNGQISFGKERYGVEIDSMAKRISKPYLMEGNLPTKENEVAVGVDVLRMLDAKIGDKVKLVVTDTFSTEALKCEEFTIVGIAGHPDYLRQDSKHSVYLADSAFDQEVTEGRYTRAYVRLNMDHSIDVFSDEYEDVAKPLQEQLEKDLATFSLEQAQIIKAEKQEEFDKVKEEGQAKIDEAEKKLKEAEEKISTGEEELASAKQQLEDAKANADTQFANAQNQIDQGKAQLASAYNQLMDGEKKYEEGAKTIQDARAQIDAAYEQAFEAGRKVQEVREQVMTVAMYGEMGIETTKSFVEQYKGDETLSPLRTRAINLLDCMVNAIDKLANSVDEAYYPVAQAMMNQEDTTEKEAIANQEISTAKSTFLTDLAGVEVTDEDITTIKEWIEEIGGEYVGEYGDYIVDILNKGKDHNVLANTIEDFGKAKSVNRACDEAEQKINDGLSELVDKENELGDAEQELNLARIELDEKWEEYNAGQQKIAQGEAELQRQRDAYPGQIEQAEAQIRAGEKELEDGKKQYEEGKKEFDEQKKLFEEETSKAQELIDKIKGIWITQNYHSNLGHMDVSTNYKSINAAGTILGVLFVLIAGLVTASTLTIMINEQRKQVGTTKAFGFHNNEIVQKYLIFGLTAAIIGSLAGLGVSYLIAQGILKIMNGVNSYFFLVANPSIPVPVMMITVVLAVIVCVIVTFLTCIQLTKTPASLLMKGDVLKKNKNKKAVQKQQSSKSLYSRLILRNMINDKARVLVTIGIIAGSCLIVGLGVTMKNAFDGMINHQISDVFVYDMRVNLPSDIDEETMDSLEAKLNSLGTSHAKALSQSFLYDQEDGISGLSMIVGDDRLSEFIQMVDPETKEGFNRLPKEGVVAQQRFLQAFDYEIGDSIVVYDNQLQKQTTQITGAFTNYYGRYVLASNEAYEKIFHEEAKPNVIYVHYNGASEEEVRNELLKISDDLGFETPETIIERTKPTAAMYNMAMLIMMLIAIMLSFMILLNLTNIYISKKRKEVIIMRINGFSYKDTIGYLIKETIATTLIGIVIGVLLGAIIAPRMIETIQADDSQFIKDFSFIAWGTAIGLELLFAFVVNFIAYRQIRKFNMREITA